MRSRKLALLFALGMGAAATTVTPEADAVVVERVVAVIGDQAILLSDLRERARPFLMQIYRQVPGGPQRAAAESQMYKDLVEKMVEEHLIDKAADKASLRVSPTEIDRAFENIARQQRVTKSQLFAQAEAQSGLSEQDYRDEIKRQIVEGKMLQLRVKGRIRMTEQELRSAYNRAKRDELLLREYRPAWTVLRLLPDASPEAVKERFALAETIVKQARAGEDFAVLAQKYSDDTATKDKGGYLGVRAPRPSPQAQMGKREVIAPELEQLVLNMAEGDTADPIKLGDAIIVIHLIDRQPSRFTTFEESKDEMVGLVQTEKLQAARDEWLEDLKGKTFVDIRL